MYTYNDIEAVHLEITQKCQASCPMCDRNENGGKENTHLTNSELTLEDCKKIFPKKFISQLKTLQLCGNLGDPIIAKDTLEVIQYFRQNNAKLWISMNTNAGAKSADWWINLADVLGRLGAVIFSVDGLKTTNHLYRQNVQWEIVEQSMRSFIGAGGRARWDFIIFQHNEHQLEDAKKLSKNLGFEKFVAKKTGRFFTATNKGKETHQAKNKKGKETTLLSKPKQQKNINLSLLKEKNLIKQYGSMMEYYNNCKIKCKVKEKKEIFITAEGLMMPCCWAAGRMYKWWHKDPKVEQIWDFIEEIGGKNKLNTKIHSLEKVINETNLLDNIVKSWSKSSLKEGKLGVCAQKCGTEFDPFGDQYR